MALLDPLRKPCIIHCLICGGLATEGGIATRPQCTAGQMAAAMTLYFIRKLIKRCPSFRSLASRCPISAPRGQ